MFLQNLGPGAAGRLGLAADDLLARHPRLICGAVSGYGADGPYAGKKAYDLLVQCETGVLSVTGTPDEPCKTGISVADIAAGMYAYSAVLTALYERERTGRGSSFEVSLLDALGEWMTQPYYYTVYGGTGPARTGARHASISPYGPYAAGGGAGVGVGPGAGRKARCSSACRTTASGWCSASRSSAGRSSSRTRGSRPTRTG